MSMPIPSISVTVRSVYGEIKFYPANGAAECLARIAGTKTITVHAMKEARAMGCEIVVDGTKTLLDLISDLIAAI